MKTADDKLKEILGILRRSVPVINRQEEFTEGVIERIRNEKSGSDLSLTIYEFLFGWVYVSWVRRCVVAVSMAIILFFGYEQTVFMKRISELSGKRYPESVVMMTDIKGNYPEKLLLYRIFSEKTILNRTDFSEEQIDRFIRSVNELQTEYHDLLKLIDRDPGLKKYVEEKLKESKSKKNKI